MCAAAVAFALFSRATRPQLQEFSDAMRVLVPHKSAGLRRFFRTIPVRGTVVSHRGPPLAAPQGPAVPAPQGPAGSAHPSIIHLVHPTPRRRPAHPSFTPVAHRASPSSHQIPFRPKREDSHGDTEEAPASEEDQRWQEWFREMEEQDRSRGVVMDGAPVDGGERIGPAAARAGATENAE